MFTNQDFYNTFSHFSTLYIWVKLSRASSFLQTHLNTYKSSSNWPHHKFFWRFITDQFNVQKMKRGHITLKFEKTCVLPKKLIVNFRVHISFSLDIQMTSTFKTSRISMCENRIIVLNLDSVMQLWHHRPISLVKQLRWSILC